MGTCEICEEEVAGDIIEHRAEEHDVYAIGVGASGKIYYADLKTVDEIKNPKEESGEPAPAFKSRVVRSGHKR